MWYILIVSDIASKQSIKYRALRHPTGPAALRTSVPLAKREILILRDILVIIQVTQIAHIYS